MIESFARDKENFKGSPQENIPSRTIRDGSFLFFHFTFRFTDSFQIKTPTFLPVNI